MLSENKNTWHVISTMFLNKGVLLTTDYNFYEQLFMRSSKGSLKDAMWLIRGVAARQEEKYYPFIKRALDIMFCLVLMPVMLPLGVLTYFAIRFIDGIPPFFFQERIGKNEKKIYIYKFRTMKPGSENITKVGSILRRFRLDEIPQLINIFKGDISIVGPRPVWTDEYYFLNKYLACHNIRSVIKPGLTGWAQLNFKAPPTYCVREDLKNKEHIPDSTFDFILCDACYLGASEVAYDLRAECRYYVASPAAVMGAGFPYEEVITHLFSLEKPLVGKLTEVCRSYMDYYRSYRDPYGAVSLIDMSSLDLLARSVNRALRHQTDSLAVDSVQQYSQERGLSISYQKLFFDLDDYVARACADSSAYAYFADCLDRTVLYADATERYLSSVLGVWHSYPLEKYCGLSAYIPGAVADSDEVIDLYYRTLAWYKKVYAGIDEILIK